MVRRQLSLLLTLLLGATMALAACGGGDDDTAGEGEADDGAESVDASGEDAAGDDLGEESDDSGEPVSGGEVIYGIISDGTGFNTTEGIGEGAIRIITALTDGVVSYNADGEVVPTILESIEPNDDATVWTLTLREGIEFHDGVAVDAAALKANFEAYKASRRSASPSPASPGSTRSTT